MTSDSVPDVLEIERVFKAEPERVFDAFASYAAMKEWFGPGECHAIAGEVDLRVGGNYRLRVTTESGEVEVVGEYRVVERPSRLEFSWRWQGNDAFHPSDSVVELSFDAHPEGTLLRLRQAGIVDDESRANHGYGWNGAFDKLENVFT